MRIGLLIYGNLETMSGGFLYDRMLVHHLSSLGDQVEVISVPWPHYGRGLLNNLSTTLLRRLSQTSWDLLLQDELIHPSFFWLNQRLRRQVSSPFIAIIHHLRCSEARPAWHNQFYRWIEHRYLSSVDGFIFNSQTSRDVVEGLIGRNSQPSVVAYPGGNRFPSPLTPAQIAARTRQPGPLALLFIGNLIPRKGLHTLLRALASLSQTQWRLTVVGSHSMDPAYAQAIRDQITQANLSNQVALVGTLSDADLAVHLAQSHMLIVPSSYEGFGIVYLEGMSYGLPAIASTAGAAREIVSHGVNGFLIPPERPTVLAQHIRELIDNRERLLTMSLAAYHRYSTHPTWADSMTLIHHFLHSFQV